MQLRIFIPKFLHRKLIGSFYSGSWHSGWLPHTWMYPVGVDYLGLWFQRKGDEICWLWPWKRNEKQVLTTYPKVWLNINTWGTHLNLEDIDRFWEEYMAVCESVTA